MQLKRTIGNEIINLSGYFENPATADLDMNGYDIILGSNSLSLNNASIKSAHSGYVSIYPSNTLRWHFVSTRLEGYTPSGAYILSYQGTPTNPIYARQGDPNTGLSFPADDIFGLVAGGIEVARGTVSYFSSKLGRTRNTTTVNASTYSLLATDDILHVTYTRTKTCRITVPTAQIGIAERIFAVKDAGGNASRNNITVATEGAETIDGAANYVINGDYDYVVIYSDGSNLFVLG